MPKWTLKFDFEHNSCISSQSLDPTVCQQLLCGYRCFMGLHIDYNLWHHYDALLCIIMMQLQVMHCNDEIMMRSNAL